MATPILAVDYSFTVKDPTDIEEMMGHGQGFSDLLEKVARAVSRPEAGTYKVSLSMTHEAAPTAAKVA